jgi:glycosyltransferase involved in cell wall biosynthesis
MLHQGDAKGRNPDAANTITDVSQPVLSAIMPVTRMAGKLAHLEALLDNCISLGIQIVIVHDEQDSKTGDELEEIVSSANSDLVSLVTKTLYSPGKARNLGIEIATGDWICFWDSDDIPIAQNFLEMVSQAKKSDHKIAVGKFREKSRNVNKVYGNSESEIGRMPGIWRFAFKNELINGRTFPKYRMGEDQVFLAKILVSEKSYFRYEEVVYEYSCDNPGQLTQNRKAISELEFAVKDMLKIIAYPQVGIRVVQTFLSRQILTLLKQGSGKLKLRSVGFIVESSKLGGKDFLIIFLGEFLVSLVNQINYRRSH